jgi:hypothetical protein
MTLNIGLYTWILDFSHPLYSTPCSSSRIHRPRLGRYSQLRHRVVLPARARLHGLAGRSVNPMPELTLSPQSGSMNSATDGKMSTFCLWLAFALVYSVCNEIFALYIRTKMTFGHYPLGLGWACTFGLQWPCTFGLQWPVVSAKLLHLYCWSQWPFCLYSFKSSLLLNWVVVVFTV